MWKCFCAEKNTYLVVSAQLWLTICWLSGIARILDILLQEIHSFWLYIVFRSLAVRNFSLAIIPGIILNKTIFTIIPPSKENKSMLIQSALKLTSVLDLNLYFFLNKNYWTIVWISGLYRYFGIQHTTLIWEKFDEKRYLMGAENRS